MIENQRLLRKISDLLNENEYLKEILLKEEEERSSEDGTREVLWEEAL